MALWDQCGWYSYRTVWSHGGSVCQFSDTVCQCNGGSHMAQLEAEWLWIVGCWDGVGTAELHRFGQDAELVQGHCG